MTTRGGLLLRYLVALGVAISWARGADAALMTASGNDISSLAITLTLTESEDTVAGTTSLSYDVALGADGGVWDIVGFGVVRARSEGAIMSADAPAGWSGAGSAHFVNWHVGASASPLAEGDHLENFSYSYAGTAPSSQLFFYLVTKDGSTPFQVASNDIPLLAPAVVVPEPTAVALVALPLMGLLYRRRS